MRVKLFFLSILLCSFTSIGNLTSLTDKVIYNELHDKFGYEPYLDIGKFSRNEFVKFYGFLNLKDVHFLVVKIKDLEKKGGIESTVKFMKSLYPSRSVKNFTRNDFFCLILFEETKKVEANNIQNALDKLFFRIPKSPKVGYF